VVKTAATTKLNRLSRRVWKSRPTRSPPTG
jgi:hypothetical protein